jgi:integrase
MTIYRRGNSWAVLVDLERGPDGKRRRHYQGGFATKREATAAEAQIRSDQNRGTFVDRNSVTVESYLGRWLQQQHDLKASTKQSYEANLRNHVVPRLGMIRLQSLTTSDLNAFYSDLLVSGRVKVGKQTGGPLSRTTVRYIATILRKALQDALVAGLIVRNVADGAQKPKQEPRSGSTMRTWNRDQISSFLAATRGERSYAVWVLFITTGLRRGEVLGLHWGDVDLDRGVASINRTLIVVRREAVEGTPKSGRGRLVALAPETVEVLRTWRRHQLEERLEWGEAWHDTGLVFTREDGTSLHPDAVTDDFRRLTFRYGLPRIRLHDLRHSWATLALEAGIPLKVVSENLGHQSIRITADSYSHVSPTMAADAVARVAQAIFG